jgi:L-2-hydroxycarboxylate dehydrogenase (NAD+)
MAHIPAPDSVFRPAEKLRSFMESIFITLGLSVENARITTDVLLEADLRGIDTHGVGRLSIYADRLASGKQNPEAPLSIVSEAPGTALLDGGAGMGQVVAVRAMEMAVRKAGDTGIAGIAVRNSSHFGFAGYFPLMAAEKGMMGMAVTNARPSICPTFGTEPMLGTNPIAFAAPTDLEFPFLFDAATSIIQRGTVELYDRLHLSVPEGLVVGESGETLTSPASILEGMVRGEASLLPLGGRGEESGGHKGYGLAVMVEILSAALQNGPYLKHVTGVGLGHFFLAIDISKFLPVETFKSVAGAILRDLQNSRKECGRDRIFVPGEKEFLIRRERMESGIPLPPDFLLKLDEMAAEVGVKPLAR